MYGRNLFFFLCLLASSSNWADAELGNVDKRILSAAVPPAATNAASVASIRLALVQGNFHIGGGFIINKHWVGTAAQVLTELNVNNTVVAVNRPTVTGGTIYTVNHIEIHQNFNPATLANDIGLLRTTNEIIFQGNVRLIPLGEPILTSYSPSVYGWGLLTATGGLAETLRASVFNTVAHATCVSRFPGVAARFINAERQICITSNTGATCTGDAGGPIVFNNAVVGIISWVEPCVAAQTSVHTRIGFYINWILRHTRADD